MLLPQEVTWKRKLLLKLSELQHPVSCTVNHCLSLNDTIIYVFFLQLKSWYVFDVYLLPLFSHSPLHQGPNMSLAPRLLRHLIYPHVIVSYNPLQFQLSLIYGWHLWWLPSILLFLLLLSLNVNSCLNPFRVLRDHALALLFPHYKLFIVFKMLRLLALIMHGPVVFNQLKMLLDLILDLLMLSLAPYIPFSQTLLDSVEVHLDVFVQLVPTLLLLCRDSCQSINWWATHWLV